MKRFLYYFVHGIKAKEFGPYETVAEAQTAFQVVYGYWPGEPAEIKPYGGPDGAFYRNPDAESTKP